MTPQQNTPAKMDRLDFVSSIVLTLFGIGILVESLRMPRLENLKVNPYTVPGVVPGFLGILLALGGLFILVRSVSRQGWRLGFTREKCASWVRSADTRRSLITLILTITYALVLFPMVPFYFASPLFVFAFVLSAESMVLGSLPRWQAVLSGLILAVITGLVIGYVFQELFYVRLPGG
jgi:hypothetical protein